MKVSAIVVAGLLSFPLSHASAQSVNDAQIASIVVTANQVDIDAGKLAKSRSTNNEVKAFVDKPWKYTIGKTGDFAYICTFHPTMKATLRVE